MSSYKNLKILLTDDLHFHKRNFKSLFTFFEKYNPTVINARAPKDWIALYGDYSSKLANLDPIVERLRLLDKDDLYSFSYKGMHVFEICKLEFLSSVIAKKEWRNQDVSNSTDQVFELAYSLDKENLLLNMAAVVFWVDWWSCKLYDIPSQDYCCIFSGSLIYSKVLIELLKKHTTEPVLLESFFTGSEYYFEKKYEHLPNNSDLAYSTYYKSIKIENDLNEYDLDRIKAANKILLSNNKNVQQPVESPEFGFSNENPVVLIIGQVVNDFSVLGTAGPLSTISQYKKIINGVLECSNYNVVFKAHPWESSKIGVEAPITKEELRSCLRDNYKDRVIIVEDYNLELALGQSDLVITLCSQAAIEAAFNGFKPVQLGNAFYGRKGFTHDYSSVECFIKDFKKGLVRGELTLSEFDLFEEFCVKSFLGHLVSVHPSGHIILRERLRKHKSVNLVTKKTGLSQNIEVDKDVIARNGEAERESDTISTKLDLTIVEKSYPEDRGKKLIKKLRNKPYAYFRDSKIAVIRPLRFFFKRR